MIAGELYMLSPELLNASFQDSQGKNKLKTSKEPQYIPKLIPGSELVEPAHWL